MRLQLLVIAATALLAFPAAASAEDYDAPDPSVIPPPPAAPNPPPSISGSAQVGGTLTGSRGTWRAGVTLTSRWLRCSVGASRCDPTGDTDLSYTVTSADIGLVIKLRVEGRFLGGRRTVDAATGTIPPLPQPGQLTAPRNATAPRIQGTTRDGELLTAATGTWTGTDPITYDYVWATCAKGKPCAIVSTASTYRLKAADVGKGIVLGVTAKNAAGSGTVVTPSSPVTAATTALKRLAPFPTVLINGRVAGAVTSISTLRLRRVPGGSTINLSCTGRGCPFRKSTVKVRKGKSRTVKLRRLQRRMRAGTTVVITVRRGNTLGKYIRLRFRRGSAPARVDRCVAPKSSKPVKCP